MNKKWTSINLTLMLVGIYVSSNAANITLVPQTGQTATMPIATPPLGSDGALQKGAAWSTNRFTLDASGSCIIDNLTGLMWVKNLNTVNSGNTLNWDVALTTAGNGSWCGYNDWRVPNINELRSLVNYGYSNPANWLKYGSGTSANPNCNSACFSNVRSLNTNASYWSSSAAVSVGQRYVWLIDMYSGGMGTVAQASALRLFPVRGGQ